MSLKYLEIISFWNWPTISTTLSTTNCAISILSQSCIIGFIILVIIVTKSSFCIAIFPCHSFTWGSPKMSWKFTHVHKIYYRFTREYDCVLFLHECEECDLSSLGVHQTCRRNSCAHEMCCRFTREYNCVLLLHESDESSLSL